MAKLPHIDIDLTAEVGKRDAPNVLAALARDKISQYDDYIHIYTDASKTREGLVGIGCWIKSQRYNINIDRSDRITDGSSVYAGEMAAIGLAVRYVKNWQEQRVGNDLLSRLSELDTVV